jgi:hypothetical protein
VPYELACETFRTKTAILDRCRAILKRTADGGLIPTEDLPFLLELFQCHDEWATKSASGVLSVAARRTEQGTRCFDLVRRDGTCEDISFVHCVGLLPTARSASRLPQALKDYRNAAREAITPQVRAFRDAALKSPCTCPITGEALTRDTAAVDHVPPQTFDRLLYTFSQGEGINPLVVRVCSHQGTVPVFEDTHLNTRWCEFHATHARLRLLSRLGNLQLPKEAMPWAQLWDGR